MQAPYRHDVCRPKPPGTLSSSNSEEDKNNPSLNVDILAEALDKHPDLRDAVVLAIQELAAAAKTAVKTDYSQEDEPVTKKNKEK
jgi:hypothetical protein